MSQLKYRFIPEGQFHNIVVPVSVALIDYEDVKACGITCREACERVAAQHDGPVAINIWDLKNSVTTTSDGIMIDGSIVAMASGDYGKINKEFGYADMLEIPWDSDEAKKLISEEPHLRQWVENYPGRNLVMHPKKLNLPVHQATITGRAGNNNSATEIMHYITMLELLMPLVGQIQMISDGDIALGKTGGIISVGIGMVVAEEYGRIVPHRQFPTGDTAHGSGQYAQTLKAHIPVIAADKRALAKYIIRALEIGMVPGRDIGSSPAVVSVARHLGAPVAGDRITDRAYGELESVGFTREWVNGSAEKMTAEEIIANARDIIPGIDGPEYYNAAEILEVKYA